MMTYMADLDTVERMIANSYRRREANGTVKEKNPDGRTLQVQVLGHGRGAWTCNTARGVWGAIRVGDRVRLDMSFGTPVVTGTYERTGPANFMQRVGEDPGVGTTDSVSTYETLLDVSGLVIPADSALEIFWTAQAQGVGTPGVADKNVRLVLNDEAGIDLSFTSGPLVTVGERIFVSPLATGFATPLRYVAGQVGQWAYSSVEGEINRVRLQAKTNDTVGTGGQDLVLGQGLAVFA